MPKFGASFALKRCKIHPSWSFLAFLIGVIAGDILVLISRPTFFGHVVWLILALSLLTAAIIMPYYFTLPLALLSGFLLMAYRAAPDFVYQDYFAELSGKTVAISGKISKDPTESSSSNKFNLTLTDLQLLTCSGHSDPTEVAKATNPTENSETCPVANLRGSLFTQVSSIEIQRSDTIIIYGELSDGFGTYSTSMFRPEIKEVKRPDPGDLFLKFRDFFAQGIKDFIPGDEAGLGLGYLLGQKAGVAQEFQDTLRIVGLTHIIVASGAHLSTLTGFAKRLGGKASRFAAFLLSALLTLAFIGVTGLSASMLRAGLVTFISLATWYIGREIRPSRLILLVAAITLVYNPAYITDLAWLLSFASFSGILVLGPALTKFFYGKSRKPGPLASTLLSSIAAALLCSPVLLFFFGQISLISILANLLVLPTISIAMGLTFLTGLFAALGISPLAFLAGKLATIILDYQISVVNFFGAETIFLIEIEPYNPLIFILYLPILAMGGLSLIGRVFPRFKKQKRIFREAV